MPMVRLAFGHVVTTFMALAVLGQCASCPLLGQSQAPDDSPPPSSPGAKEPKSGLDAIKQDNPGFLVRAAVDRVTGQYREGESLSIQVVSEVDAYLYVLYKQADGNIFQVFPNSSQPDNRVKARQAVTIPGNDDTFRWIVGPPFGKELVKVIASKEPLTFLSNPALRERRFNPMTPEQVKGIELELGAEPPPWAEDFVNIQTYPRNHEFEAGKARRYGLFIGISEYEFGELHKIATDGRQTLASPPGNRDARRMAKVFEEVGQLSGLRLLTNQQATRHSIEEAITQSLPEQARPGDTVFIYFSGLTTIAEEGDVYLTPYDAMTTPVFALLVKQYQSRQLKPQWIPRVESLIHLIKTDGVDTPSDRDLATEAMYITNRMLAHWLQHLAGRQIVLILDVPFAGTFAPSGAKDMPQLTESTMVQSFGHDLDRLKGIGQQEIALIAACGPQDPEVRRSPSGLSAMTFILSEVLATAPGGLTLEDAFHRCSEQLARVLDSVNREQQAAGKPAIEVRSFQLYNTCTKPVYLRP